MNGTVWCGVVVQIWFVRTAYLMDGSVDTKMWLIFIVVENVTERVELMWTCGLEYTHVSFVRAVSCKQSSSSSYKALQPSCKHYSCQTRLLQLIYKTLFVTDRYRDVFTRSAAMVLWRRLYCSQHDRNWTECTPATALISIYVINVLVFCCNKLNLVLLLRYRYHTANRTSLQGRSAYRMTGFAVVIVRLAVC